LLLGLINLNNLEIGVNESFNQLWELGKCDALFEISQGKVLAEFRQEVQ
jgi:hypothetical protein